ncbi:MAG TPA: hypothetical protein VF744_05375 [Beijerinckiaceae bacterium]
MKYIALTLSLLLMGATAASAQGIEIRPGRSDGVRIGVGSDRNDDRGMHRGRHDRDDRVVVRRRGDVRSTGNVGCRTTIVKKEDGFGRMTTKRIKTCS